MTGFNVDKIQETLTVRERRLAEAAAFADIDAYNFTERNGVVTYNVQVNKHYIALYSIDSAILDNMNALELISIMEIDDDGN